MRLAATARPAVAVRDIVGYPLEVGAALDAARQRGGVVQVLGQQQWLPDGRMQVHAVIVEPTPKVAAWRRYLIVLGAGFAAVGMVNVAIFVAMNWVSFVVAGSVVAVLLLLSVVGGGPGRCAGVVAHCLGCRR